MRDKSICFIDTPGINNSENTQHGKITEYAIKRTTYDAVIYVSNCQYFGTCDERKILELLRKNVKKPIIFVLNQLDKFRPSEDSITKMYNDYRDDLTSLGFINPTIVPVSAKAALLLRLHENDIEEDDLYERMMFEKKFAKTYYDLSGDIIEINNKKIIDKTGIKSLELNIIKMLN